MANTILNFIEEHMIALVILALVVVSCIMAMMLKVSHSDYNGLMDKWNDPVEVTKRAQGFYTDQVKKVRHEEEKLIKLTSIIQ